MKKAGRSRKLWVLDVVRGQLSAAVGQKRSGTGFEILGAGSVPATGIACGDIAHLGDAVESVVAALRQAERSSGLACDALYYAFDDRMISSSFYKASRVLEGEGEIQLSDVENVRSVAQRLGDSFEETTVYTAESGFLIDDKDAVQDPVGVFARKLELTLHILKVRAQHLENWRILMRRAGVDAAVPIFSSWAAYCGVLAPEDRKRKRLIADLSEALSVLFVASPRGIVDLRAVPGPWSEEDLLVSLKALTDTHPDLEESLVTGEGAENGDWPERFNRATGRPAWLARPKDISGYASPAEATLAGLLRVADDLTARTPILKRDKQLVTGLRDRAVALINEYF